MTREEDGREEDVEVVSRQGEEKKLKEDIIREKKEGRKMYSHLAGEERTRKS